MNKPVRRRFTDTEKKIARKLLLESGKSRDSLPYTAAFDELYWKFVRASQADHGLFDRHQFWLLLAGVAKQGNCKVEAC